MCTIIKHLLVLLSYTITRSAQCVSCYNLAQSSWLLYNILDCRHKVQCEGVFHGPTRSIDATVRYRFHARTGGDGGSGADEVNDPDSPTSRPARCDNSMAARAARARLAASLVLAATSRTVGAWSSFAFSCSLASTAPGCKHRALCMSVHVKDAQHMRETVC